MITIPLSKPEAKLARDACSAEGQELLFTTGPNTMTRPAWSDVARCLEWYGTDLERKRTLGKRKAADELAGRLDAAIEHWDREHPAVDVKPGKTTQRQLELA